MSSDGRRTVRIEIANESAWPIDIVWENAQDLEHVATLHRGTNDAFEILEIRPGRDGQPYESMTFLVKRRLFGVLPVVTFGVRRIVGFGEIRQVDLTPTFGVSTALWSSLERHPDDPSRTILRDRIEISVPRLLRPFVGVFEAALRRHTRRQCEEDETFRARRHELRERGIHLPYSLLGRPLWERTFRATDAGGTPPER
jgi:hypothetical protein